MAHTWAAVSTVFAPSWLIAMHAAYLRAAGCGSIVYFIDQPESFVDSPSGLDFSGASFVLCDDDYWRALGGRPATVPKRQMANVAVAKRRLPEEFTLHIDIDEFPLFNTSAGEILANLPMNCQSARMPNVERVLLTDSTRWIDGILRLPSGRQDVIDRVYGPRSRFLGRGLASYIHGKSFTRNEPHVIAGLHGEIRGEREISEHTIASRDAVVVHFDCIAPAHWAWKIHNRVHQRTLGIKMFSHELRALEFVKSAPDPREAAAKLAGLLHVAKPAEAARWQAAGVARPMPPVHLAQLESAAADPHWLTLGFAERSLAAFYRAN